MTPKVPPKSGAFGRNIHDSDTFADFLTAWNTGLSSCQFAVSTNSLSITSPVTGEPTIKFLNSASSGQGGYLFTIESTIAGTTGTLPFVISAIEFNVNDDSSRDFCIHFGHGFTPEGTLAPGAQWGASGIEFEQHFNPSSGINQSETYFIHVSRAGQEYRGFSVTHQNHDRSDGTDTLLVGISADTIEFQGATFVSRATWTDSGLQMASGQAFSLAAGIASWNGTTGALISTALNNTLNATLTTDDNACLHINPVVNLSSSKTASATFINPSYTLATSADFFGHRGSMLSNRAMNTHGFADCTVGVAGAVTIANDHCYRGRLWATSSGQLTSAAVVHIRTPFVSGGTISNGYGLLIEDHTGYYAIQTGTGKISLGTSSANSLVGFHGATPIAQQTVAAAATDLATVITLANSLRTLGINSGLFKA